MIKEPSSTQLTGIIAQDPDWESLRIDEQWIFNGSGLA
jgi:hypothetical protein